MAIFNTWIPFRMPKTYLNPAAATQMTADPFRIWISLSHSRLRSPVAKFIIPGWGDKVDSGIGLSYWPARLHRRSQLSLQVRDYEFGYSIPDHRLRMPTNVEQPLETGRTLGRGREGVGSNFSS